MGLLRGLGLANPTSSWTEDPAVRTEVDLDRGLLCGVGQGDPFRLLSFLGSARRHAVFETWFEFPEKGIIVEAVEGKVTWFAIVLGEDPDHDVRPFRGSFRHKGMPLRASAIAREEDVLRLFGLPGRRERDDEEEILTYTIGDGWREVELDLEGRVKTIDVVGPSRTGREGEEGSRPSCESLGDRLDRMLTRLGRFLRDLGTILFMHFCALAIVLLVSGVWFGSFLLFRAGLTLAGMKFWAGPVACLLALPVTVAFMYLLDSRAGGRRSRSL